MQNFRALGFRPQIPKTVPPPPLRMSGYAPGCAFERRSPLELGEKSAPVLVKTFFFGLHLICSPEKNRGRGSSPQC